MEASVEERALLEQAGSAAMSRIRLDRQRVSHASPELARLLDHLAERLFDKNLNVGIWFRACKVRSNTLKLRFRDELRETPHAYYNHLRIDTARELVRHTDIEFWRIAELLGYSDFRTFERAFRRWTDLTPTAFRHRFQDAKNKKPKTHHQELKRVQPLRMLQAGVRNPRLEAQLAERLLSDYPQLRELRQAAAKPGGEIAISEKPDEKLKANNVWKKLKERDFAEQLEVARLQISFRTTALFDLLREKSLEEGRVDHERGVQLAEVALASLDGFAPSLGADLPNKRAQGWICLGNAYWLADEFSSAERAFCRAELELANAEEHRDPLVHTELLGKKANLRWYQRHYEEALRLAEQAIAAAEEAGHQVLLAQCLILRGCIRQDHDDPKAAITDFQKGLDIITEQDHPYVWLSAQSGLAAANRLIGEYEEAERALAKAMALCEMIGDQVKSNQLGWSAGLLHQAKGSAVLAEHYLGEARAGFMALGEVGYSGVVSLDLAILYSEEARSSEAKKMVIEALPMLEAHMKGTEALAAVQVLSKAIATDEVSLAALRNARARLGAMLLEPPARQ